MSPPLPVPGAAVLPLPGGRAGAGVRVTPLLCGRILAMPHFFQRPSGPLAQLRGLDVHVPRSRWTAVPIPAFLLEHPEAGPIVVDTGLHASVASDPKVSLGRLGAAIFSCEMQEDWALPGRLREHGVAIEDVRLAVMTHLHHDHASGLEQLAPGTTVVCDAREWAAASTGGMLQGYRPQQLDPALDWRLLDLDGAPGDGAFSRALDLFGDGSVRVLSTRGHSPGHLSLLVRGEDGAEILLTGDAAYAKATLRDSLLPVFVDDIPAYRESLGALQRHLAAHPDTRVACGHDPDDWPPGDLAAAQPGASLPG